MLSASGSENSPIPLQNDDIQTICTCLHRTGNKKGASKKGSFVRIKGLEPPRPKASDPKSDVATNYTISANIRTGTAKAGCKTGFRRCVKRVLERPFSIIYGASKKTSAIVRDCPQRLPDRFLSFARIRKASDKPNKFELARAASYLLAKITKKPFSRMDAGRFCRFLVTFANYFNRLCRIN